MTIRFLCDEHVEPRTADQLIARGIEATLLTDRPGLGASDDAVAARAREIDAVVLTNDQDFLDSSRFADVTVFYYPENHLAAHRLAERVESALQLVTNTNDLPDRLFLTSAYENSD